MVSVTERDESHQARTGLRSRGAESTLAPAPLLTTLVDALEAAGRNNGAGAAHQRAMRAWLLEDAELLTALVVQTLGVEQLGGAARTYRHVAVLGFAAAAGQCDEQATRALADGLEWLAGREWFAAGRVLTFEADAVAIMGVALGTTAIGTIASDEAEVRLHAWAARIVQSSLGLILDEWERAIVEAGHFMLDRSDERAARVRQAAPDLAAALAARGLLTITSGDEAAALDVIFALTYRENGPERAATQLVALRWLLRSLPVALPGRAIVADVITLLNGVQHSLRRWRWETSPTTRGGQIVRWPINNEYHVQDLLWVVLAPVFSDLEDEENLPSLGHKHPRYDLGIPSLRLIIEVKFIYRGDNRDFADVIEQVAADANLYLRADGRYSEIIAVLWDDTRHAEQYAEVTQALLSIRGIVGVVILARPGKMGDGRRAQAFSARPEPTSPAEPVVPKRRRGST